MLDPITEKKLKVVEDLVGKWQWHQIRDDGLFKNLILTTMAQYRKDMKTTQRVGKGKNSIKFQFQNGFYQRPHAFVIEAGDPRLRLTWVTQLNETQYTKSNNFFRIHGKICGKLELDAWEVHDLLGPDNEDHLKFMKVVYPELKVEALDLLTKFRYGLDNVHEELRQRFGGSW